MPPSLSYSEGFFLSVLMSASAPDGRSEVHPRATGAGTVEQERAEAEGRDSDIGSSASLPARSARAALLVARLTLHAHHRVPVELLQRTCSRVGAGAAHPRDELVQDVLHPGAIRIEVHARGADALLE